jgi:hypothetical protein
LKFAVAGFTFAAMSKSHPQNGATLTKGKPIKGPPRPPDPAREAAQLAVDQLDAAKSREFDKRAATVGLARAAFPDLKPKETIKRRKI